MRILAVSAHPDDETLGCGGTLLKHRSQGDDLFWVIATRPVEPQWPKAVIDQKSEEVRRVAAAYGMSKTFRLDFPSTALDRVPMSELVDRMTGILNEVQPNWIYTVGNYDVHSDHLALFDALMIALKPFRWHGPVRKIMTCELLSSTEGGGFRGRTFVPQVYSDITAYLSEKLRIMGLYESELQESPLPRSADALAALGRCRGAAVGLEYAEAFMLVREVF
jgi:N-acetylglucosamine malate deacetylase 1